ncbi:MAG: PCRF domain-containing protein, partial [Actinobacteria bacterium]
MDLSDRLSEIEERYERLQGEMASPDVARDPDRLRRLGKDLSELGEIVAPFREYRTALHQAQEARTLAKDESDPEMAAYLREEAEAAEARAGELHARLEALLVPKDPNDGKDVVVEIRAGAGGDEAALWAGTL